MDLPWPSRLIHAVENFLATFWARPYCWFKSWLARHTLVIEFCHDCGRRVWEVWWAADELWREVMPGDYAPRCVRCFDRRADAKGLLIRWTPSIEIRRAALSDYRRTR